MPPLIDIIYNMTAVCPHDCPGCCVDAAYVYRRGQEVIMRVDGLANEIRTPRGDRSTSIFDQAAKALAELGRELTLEQKMKLLSNVDIDGVRLDVSGGDPLAVSDNVTVLKAASAKLGRANVTLTATGSGLARVDLVELSALVGEFNFTYDAAAIDDVADRPDAYASANLAVGRKLAALGATTRAEFPITSATNNPDHIRRLYINLHEAGIEKLLLMRLFPSGRGASIGEKTLSAPEYATAIAQLRDLEREFGSPKVKLQCALRFIEAHLGTAPMPEVNPCDMVRESFGLTPLGDLLVSPWAINAKGRPTGPDFVLGNLVHTPLSEILESAGIAKLRSRTNENFGHCKFFAERFSTRGTTLDRLHDATDPLYAETVSFASAAE
ncbi:MAG: hypothetical protein WBO29_05315 [Albidovulum sp.]